jgi:hypothetical protein
MKKMYAILAVGLMAPYAVSNADAEGPINWTARHVTKAAVEATNTLSNVARTAGRTIDHRTRAIRKAVE